MLLAEILWSLTATEILRLTKSDKVIVEDYAKAIISRIELRDGVVKAWKLEIILNHACALDQVPPAQRGRLHGVAIAVKDIMDTKDMPTEYGSPLYKGYRSNSDASIVAILRKAGALIIGKMTTTEFTVLNSGPDTTNPHDPNRTPGGSSAGSAAAIADFQVPISLGTQTRGSVIRPASYTGTYAMKSTFDTISGAGIKVASLGFDTVGYFARSIEDLELITEVLIISPEKSIQGEPLEKVKVGFVKSPFWPSAGPGTKAAMKKAAEILRNYGVFVEDVKFKDQFNDSGTLNRMFEVVIVTNAGVSLYKDALMDTEKTKMHPDVLKFVEKASQLHREEVRRAFGYYAAIRPLLDKLAVEYSALVTPSATDEASLGLEDMGSPIFNSAWTLMPVIQVPAFVRPNGMPVGLSIIACRYSDRHLLEIAKILSGPLMKEGGWQNRLVYTEIDLTTENYHE
ncbi:amidase signature enzyme [Corynespora cassiicola Philippines]|uniref:Amidase signature enzyme n=1 Tax=Corynespora cassiicola Philippines TaxID=1448308 RepID=A0A2T2NI85_CORCC|nr:amidase signature enzyme [Corynespora cassiicola Philippines]